MNEKPQNERLATPPLPPEDDNQTQPAASQPNSPRHSASALTFENLMEMPGQPMEVDAEAHVSGNPITLQFPLHCHVA